MRKLDFLLPYTRYRIGFEILCKRAVFMHSYCTFLLQNDADCHFLYGSTVVAVVAQNLFVPSVYAPYGSMIPRTVALTICDDLPYFLF